MAWDARKCNKCNTARETLIRKLVEEQEAVQIGLSTRRPVVNTLYRLVEDLYGKEAINEAHRRFDDWSE